MDTLNRGNRFLEAGGLNFFLFVAKQIKPERQEGPGGVCPGLCSLRFELSPEGCQRLKDHFFEAFRA